MEELKILNDCRIVVRYVFKIIKTHPEYRFTINPQLIRSSLSIGSNIAEGNMRRNADRKHFFDIALGSLEETRFQLSVYEDYKNECEDTLNKIRGTVIKLQSQSQSQSPSQSK